MEFIEFASLDMTQEFNMTEPHSHDYYEFYFLTDGTRYFFIEDRMFSIEKNTLIVIPPFIIHKTEGGPYKRINVNISGNYFSAYEKTIVDNLIFNEVTLIEDKVFIYKLLEEGAMAQKSDSPYKNEIMAAYFHALIAFLGAQKLKSVSKETMFAVNSYSSDILKVINYLNHNYTKKISLQEIANSFFMSRTKLCSEFKKVMYCSVNEYITTLKVSAAKQMLDQTDMTMEEIAFACGFSSASYFGLAFKKETGKAPSYFRKR